MDAYALFAQAVGIAAMFFNILSFQQRTRQRVIAFQLIGGALFAANFLMLGAYVGGILNVIAVIRALIFLNKERFRADHILWQVGFAAVYLLSYLLTFTVFGKPVTLFNCVTEFLPIVGMVASTISFRYSDAKTIRRFSLISSPSWLVYNIANFAVGATICEVFCLVSIVVGILRLDRQKK